MHTHGRKIAFGGKKEVRFAHDWGYYAHNYSIENFLNSNIYTISTKRGKNVQYRKKIQDTA